MTTNIFKHLFKSSASVTRESKLAELIEAKQLIMKDLDRLIDSINGTSVEDIRILMSGGSASVMQKYWCRADSRDHAQYIRSQFYSAMNKSGPIQCNYNELLEPNGVDLNIRQKAGLMLESINRAFDMGNEDERRYKITEFYYIFVQYFMKPSVLFEKPPPEPSVSKFGKLIKNFVFKYTGLFKEECVEFYEDHGDECWTIFDHITMWSICCPSFYGIATILMSLTGWYVVGAGLFGLMCSYYVNWVFPAWRLMMNLVRAWIYDHSKYIIFAISGFTLLMILWKLTRRKETKHLGQSVSFADHCPIWLKDYPRETQMVLYESYSAKSENGEGPLDQVFYQLYDSYEIFHSGKGDRSDADRFAARSNAIFTFVSLVLGCIQGYLLTNKQPLTLFHDFKNFILTFTSGANMFKENIVTCVNFGKGFSKCQATSIDDNIMCSACALMQVSKDISVKKYTDDDVLYKPEVYEQELRFSMLKYHKNAVPKHLPEWFLKLSENVQSILADILKIDLPDLMNKNYYYKYEKDEAGTAYFKFYIRKIKNNNSENQERYGIGHTLYKAMESKSPTFVAGGVLQPPAKESNQCGFCPILEPAPPLLVDSIVLDALSVIVRHLKFCDKCHEHCDDTFFSECNFTCCVHDYPIKKNFNFRDWYASIGLLQVTYDNILSPYESGPLSDHIMPHRNPLFDLTLTRPSTPIYGSRLSGDFQTSVYPWEESVVPYFNDSLLDQTLQESTAIVLYSDLPSFRETNQCGLCNEDDCKALLPSNCKNLDPTMFNNSGEILSITTSLKSPMDNNQYFFDSEQKLWQVVAKPVSFSKIPVDEVASTEEVKAKDLGAFGSIIPGWCIITNIPGFQYWVYILLCLLIGGLLYLLYTYGFRKRNNLETSEGNVAGKLALDKDCPSEKVGKKCMHVNCPFKHHNVEESVEAGINKKHREKEFQQEAARVPFMEASKRIYGTDEAIFSALKNPLSDEKEDALKHLREDRFRDKVTGLDMRKVLFVFYDPQDILKFAQENVTPFTVVYHNKGEMKYEIVKNYDDYLNFKKLYPSAKPVINTRRKGELDRMPVHFTVVIPHYIEGIVKRIHNRDNLNYNQRVLLDNAVDEKKIVGGEVLQTELKSYEPFIGKNDSKLFIPREGNRSRPRAEFVHLATFNMNHPRLFDKEVSTFDMPLRGGKEETIPDNINRFHDFHRTALFKHHNGEQIIVPEDLMPYCKDLTNKNLSIRDIRINDLAGIRRFMMYHNLPGLFFYDNNGSTNEIKESGDVEKILTFKDNPDKDDVSITQRRKIIAHKAKEHMMNNMALINNVKDILVPELNYIPSNSVEELSEIYKMIEEGRVLESQETIAQPSMFIENIDTRSCVGFWPSYLDKIERTAKNRLGVGGIVGTNVVVSRHLWLKDDGTPEYDPEDSICVWMDTDYNINFIDYIPMTTLPPYNDVDVSLDLCRVMLEDKFYKDLSSEEIPIRVKAISPGNGNPERCVGQTIYGLEYTVRGPIMHPGTIISYHPFLEGTYKTNYPTFIHTVNSYRGYSGMLLFDCSGRCVGFQTRSLDGMNLNRAYSINTIVHTLLYDKRPMGKTIIQLSKN